MATKKQPKKSNVQRVRSVKTKTPATKKSATTAKKKKSTANNSAGKTTQPVRKPTAVFVDSYGHIIVDYK